MAQFWQIDTNTVTLMEVCLSCYVLLLCSHNLVLFLFLTLRYRTQRKVSRSPEPATEQASEQRENFQSNVSPTSRGLARCSETKRRRKGRNRNLTRPASGRYRFFVNFGRLHSGKWQFLCRRRRPRRHPSPLELTTIPSFSVTTGSSRPCFGRSQSTYRLQGITSCPCRPRSSRTRGRRWPTGCSKYARTEAAIRRSSASP